MTDKELLEAAARAAGGWLYDGTDGLCLCTSQGHRLWNPLTSDGDALRLAVKLGMLISQGKRRDGVPVAYAETAIDRFIEVHGEDSCAATRRAIVRLAAALGSLHNK